MKKVISFWQVGDTVVSILAASETWSVTEIKDGGNWAKIECCTRENTIYGNVQMLLLGGLVAYRNETLQDLRNCHKQWRGYAAPSAKQLEDKHGNIRTF